MRRVEARAAEARMSALVEAAERGEPTMITRHGRPAAVIVPVDVARRLYPDAAPTFSDFLTTFPGGLDEVERDRTPPRSIDL